MAVRTETRERDQRCPPDEQPKKRGWKTRFQVELGQESGEAEIGNKVSEVGAPLFMAELGSFETS